MFLVNRHTGEILEVIVNNVPKVRPWWWRESVKTIIIGESMTHQAHKDATDVNNIIKRYERTGILPPQAQEPQFADVTGLQGDLTERINQSRDVLAQAREFEKGYGKGKNMETKTGGMAPPGASPAGDAQKASKAPDKGADAGGTPAGGNPA